MKRALLLLTLCLAGCDKAYDEMIAKHRAAMADHEKRQAAYMRECVPRESEQRCLELWKWVHRND